MPEQTEDKKDFGCSACWPASAEGAYAATSTISLHKRLVDESHYIVMIGECLKCQQLFIDVFTETIDWTGGEDPQFRTCMPITGGEADLLSKIAATENELLLRKTLEELSPERRSLKIDWPKGQAQTRYWGAGILVLPYD